MKVTCVDNSGEELTLTAGKKYTVLKRESGDVEDLVTILNDNFAAAVYNESRFVPDDGSLSMEEALTLTASKLATLNAARAEIRQLETKLDAAKLAVVAYEADYDEAKSKLTQAMK